MLLADQLPKDPGYLQAMGHSRFKADSLAKLNFARAMNVYLNPMEVFERAATGVVTPMETKLIKQMWPQKYIEFRNQFIERLPEIQKTSTYDQRIRWSVFFEAPVDSVMRPDFRSFIQEQFIQRAADAQPKLPSGGKLPGDPKLKSEQLDARRQGL
jgi:hypothetical protein